MELIEEDKSDIDSRENLLVPYIDHSKGDNFFYSLTTFFQNDYIGKLQFVQILLRQLAGVQRVDGLSVSREEIVNTSESSLPQYSNNAISNVERNNKVFLEDPGVDSFEGDNYFQAMSASRLHVKRQIDSNPFDVEIVDDWVRIDGLRPNSGHYITNPSSTPIFNLREKLTSVNRDPLLERLLDFYEKGRSIDIILSTLENEKPSSTNQITSTKRGQVGLCPLCHRLNSIERVRNDIELKRVFKGKYGKKYEFEPYEEKKVGGEAGTIYRKKHTCNKPGGKQKLWLGKTGLNDRDRYGDDFTDPKNSFIKNTRGLNLSVTLEYIASCLYRVFSDGTFETPKYRLSELPLLDKFTKKSELVEHIMKKWNVKRSLRIMSKWCEEYQDLGRLRVKDENGNLVKFIKFVTNTRTIPSNVVIVGENGVRNEVKLQGVMGLLAAATSIGDPDAIGIQGGNTGFVINRNYRREIISISVVKVDPGWSFQYEFVRGNECEYSDTRDIRFCTNLYYGIEWNRLTRQQKFEFLEVKLHHLEIIKSRKILEYVFFRDGVLNEGNTVRTPKKVADDLIVEIIAHIENEGRLYHQDMVEYLKIRETYLSKLCDYYEDIGDYDRALSCAEKLVDIFERKNPSFGKTLFRKIVTIGNVSRIELQRGNLNRSYSFCLKQLKLLRPFPNVVVSQPFNTLGVIFQSQGDFQRAIKLHKICLSIDLKCKNENHQLETSLDQSYINIGIAYLSLGNFSKSIEFLKKAKEIMLNTFTENHPRFGILYNNIGHVYSKLGDYEKAIENLERGLAIEKKSMPESHPSIAVSYNNLGLVYYELKDYTQSIECHERALDIELKTLPENHPRIARSYGNIASVYYRRGDLDKSIIFFNKSLAIEMESLRDNHPSIAVSYNNLGRIYTEKGDFVKACQFLYKSLKIQLQNLPETHPTIAKCYGNIAGLFFKQGKFEKAIKFSTKSLAIKLKALPENHPDTGNGYYVIGTIYRTKRMYGEAVKCFHRAYEIFCVAFGETHSITLNVLKNLRVVDEKRSKQRTYSKWNQSRSCYLL